MLRPIGADELPLMLKTLGASFGERVTLAETDEMSRSELERTIAGFDGDQLVTTGRNFSLELTLPGGVVLPAGGVSWISTQPSHRRRGLLRQVMTALVEDSRTRGEAASILTASESGIYSRFGYGVASRSATIWVPQAAARFRNEVHQWIGDLEVHMVDAEAALGLAPAVFDQARRDRTGVVGRPASWWPEDWFDDNDMEPSRRFDAVVSDASGPVGYVLYGVEGKWHDGFSEQRVFVRDLVATSAQAEAALWRFLLGLDLVTGVRAWNTAVDLDLNLWLTDPRQVRTERVSDFLWLRPIDTVDLLSQRRYGRSGSLVLEVADPFLELEETVGRFRIDGGRDGAACVRTRDAADLSMDAAALGSMVLGGTRPSRLARAGVIDAADPDCLDRADAMFGADREPYGSTWF